MATTNWTDSSLPDPEARGTEMLPGPRLFPSGMSGTYGQRTPGAEHTSDGGQPGALNGGDMDFSGPVDQANLVHRTGADSGTDMHQSPPSPTN